MTRIEAAGHSKHSVTGVHTAQYSVDSGSTERSLRHVLVPDPFPPPRYVRAIHYIGHYPAIIKAFKAWFCACASAIGGAVGVCVCLCACVCACVWLVVMWWHVVLVAVVCTRGAKQTAPEQPRHAGMRWIVYLLLL